MIFESECCRQCKRGMLLLLKHPPTEPEGTIFICIGPVWLPVKTHRACTLVLSSVLLYKEKDHYSQEGFTPHFIPCLLSALCCPLVPVRCSPIWHTVQWVNGPRLQQVASGDWLDAASWKVEEPGIYGGKQLGNGT